MSKEELNSRVKKIKDQLSPMKEKRIRGAKIKVRSNSGTNFFRNTFYDESFMPERAYEILSKGYTLHAVAAEFKVALTTVKAWREAHSEFEAAVEAGISASNLYLEKVSHEYLIVGKESEKLEPTAFKYLEKRISAMRSLGEDRDNKDKESIEKEFVEKLTQQIREREIEELDKE